MEYFDVVPIMPFLGVNHSLPISHISKIFVFINTEEEFIHQFTIGYMTNPILHVNKVFRYQAENWLKDTFHQITMKGIRCSEKKDTCVIVFVMFCDTKNNIQKNRTGC